jgi:uncharacterized protein (DUF2062 family)
MAIIQWLLGDKPQMVIAGALGGLVRWMTLREQWPDGLISIVVGGICAAYFSPLAYPIIDVVLSNIVADAEARRSLAAFMVGIGGIGVVGFVMDLWRVRWSKAKKEATDAEREQQ